MFLARVVFARHYSTEMRQLQLSFVRTYHLTASIRKATSALSEHDSNRLKAKSIPVKTASVLHEPDGLNFHAAYLDILPHATDSKVVDKLPVILYLTGWIGSHRPVKHFMLKLADQSKCRIIAPLWPGLCVETRGFSNYDNETFGHTVGEYAEFVLDFLQTKNVIPHKLPLKSIVAHSGGSHPTLLLSSQMHDLTESLVLICPSAPRPLSKFGYEWLHRYVADAWEFPESRKLLKPLITAALYTLPFRGFLNAEAAAALARATIRVEGDEIIAAANDLIHTNLPILLFYSDIDEWVPAHDSLVTAGTLDMHPNSKKGRLVTESYSIHNGHAEKLPPRKPYDAKHLDGTSVKAIRQAVRIVKGGSHWPQRLCPSLVLDKIQSFFSQIENENKFRK